MGTAARQAVGQIVPLARETFSEFQRHKAPWLAAAIAYFTIFAIAPLIIVVVEIAGLFLGEHEAVFQSPLRLYVVLRRPIGREWDSIDRRRHLFSAQDGFVGPDHCLDSVRSRGCGSV